MGKRKRDESISNIFGNKGNFPKGREMQTFVASSGKRFESRQESFTSAKKFEGERTGLSERSRGRSKRPAQSVKVDDTADMTLRNTALLNASRKAIKKGR